MIIEQKKAGNTPWQPIAEFGGLQRIMPGQSLSWREVLRQSAIMGLGTIILSPDYPPIPDLPRMVRTRENVFLGGIYTLCQTLQRRGRSYIDSFAATFAGEIEETARNIRNRKDYVFLDSLSTRVNELVLADFDRRDIFQVPYKRLYGVVCGRERFLVSAKTTPPLWRSIHLQEGSPTELARQIEGIDGYFAPRLHQFDSRNAVVVPDYFLYPDDLVGLSIPEPETKVEDALEEAY